MLSGNQLINPYENELQLIAKKLQFNCNFSLQLKHTKFGRIAIH